MAFNLFPQTDFRQMDLNYVLDVSKQAAANLEEYAADKEQVAATQAAAERALAAAQEDIQTASAAATSASQDAQTATQAAGTATQAATSASQDAQTASSAAQTARQVQESIPADYTQLSNDVDNLKSDLNFNHTAEPGYVLRATNTGRGNEWAMVGTPTDAQAETAINKWLNEHPEATTTVQDHSLTYKKLVNGTLGFVTPQMFGAVGNGIADDTLAIQQAIDSSYAVYFPKGTYRITMSHDRYYTHNNNNVCYGLKIQNNLLYFNDCTIEMDGHDEAHYFMLFLYNAKDTCICGKGTLIGDSESNTSGDTRGEGHVIAIMHGDNITIRDITVKNAWGDGIWLMNDGFDEVTGLTPFPKNVTVENVLCDHNRRNGLSVCCGENISIFDSIFNNSDGVDPRTGIDIEANGDGYSLKNIFISNVQSYGCTYGGFGTVMKTDGDSIIWNNAVSDGAFYLRIESGCDGGSFVANDIVCNDTVALEDNLTLLNTGTNCNVSVNNVKCKPHRDRACLTIGNREGAGKMYIANVYADMTNANNVTRCCPIFHAEPQQICNVTIKGFTAYNGTYYKPFVSSQGLANSAAVKCDWEITIVDGTITYNDSYAGFFHNDTNANNRLKYKNNTPKTVSMEQVRGNYSNYILDGTVPVVGLKYLPAGTKYLLTNTGSTDVSINTYPPQVRMSGGEQANSFVLQGGHSAELWYNENANIYNGVLY